MPCTPTSEAALQPLQPEREQQKLCSEMVGVAEVNEGVNVQKVAMGSEGLNGIREEG